LLWDFDGTLAYRPGGWSGALYAVLQKEAPALAVKTSADAIRPYLQSGFPWHAPEIAHQDLKAKDWWEELKPLFARAFRSVGVKGEQTMALAGKVRAMYTDPSGWQLYPDALPALAALTKCGWTHVLLSNHVPELPKLLKALKLRDSFAVVFNSAETGYEKPNAKAFRPALDWIGPGALTWVIGDSFHADVTGAQEAGLPAILVRQTHPEAEIFCKTLAQLIDRLPAKSV
jgi:putative hydrolase of the HAD superfamily